MALTVSPTDIAALSSGGQTIDPDTIVATTTPPGATAPGSPSDTFQPTGKPYDSREDNLGEAAAVGAYQFANQAAFGVPGIILDHTLSPDDREMWEDARSRHPGANFGSGILGTIASLAYGGPLFKAAAKAGDAAHAFVLGGEEAAEEAARATDAIQTVAEAARPGIKAGVIEQEGNLQQEAARGVVPEGEVEGSWADFKDVKPDKVQTTPDIMADTVRDPYAQGPSRKLVTEQMPETVAPEEPIRNALPPHEAGVIPYRPEATTLVDPLARGSMADLIANAGQGTKGPAAAEEALENASKALVKYHGQDAADAMEAVKEAVGEHLADQIGNVVGATPDELAARLKTANMLQATKVATAIAEHTAPGLARSVLAKVVRYGVEGAVLSAPQTLTDAALGDWTGAGESLLATIGAHTPLMLGNEALEVAAGNAVKSGRHLVDSLLTKAAAPWKQDANVAKSIGEGLGTLGGIGFLSGHVHLGAAAWVAKYLAKKFAVARGMKLGNKVLGRMGKNPFNGAFGLTLSKEAADKIKDHINAIADSLLTDNVSESIEDLHRDISSHLGSPLAKFLGDHGKGKTKQEKVEMAGAQFEAAQESIKQAAQVIAPGAPNAAAAYAKAATVAANYMAKQTPRAPMHQPFNVKTLGPTEQEIQKYEDKLSVYQDPTSVMKHIKDGTFNKDMADTLANCYPQIYGRIQGEVLRAGQSKHQSWSPDEQFRIALLLGHPITATQQNPGAMAWPIEATPPQPGKRSQGGEGKALKGGAFSQATGFERSLMGVK
jgi:hypothetical protein